MYITRLLIDRLKLLRHFSLEFTNADGTPRMWTVLLGENGRCKTSVLRAIALAASGAARSNELADLPSLPDKRETGALQIEAAFALPPNSARQYPRNPDGRPTPSALASRILMPTGFSSVRGTSSYGYPDFPDFESGEWILELGNPKAPGGELENLGYGWSDDVMFEIRGKGLAHYFVAGYGTSRLLPAPASTTQSKLGEPSVARLRSLFDRDLIGTGFADLLDEPQSFAAALRSLLVDAGVLPADVTGIELRGRGGVRTAADLVEGSRFVVQNGGREMKVPATWLSHGYQSTIAWLADLLGHLILDAGPGRALAEYEGLVLVDEIDLHLHPRWQARLITTLKRALPKMQFVVTTHSPMVLPALRREEVVLLDLDDDGNVAARQPDRTPMLLTGSELYEEFFGIRDLEPSALAEKRMRLAFLSGLGRPTEAETAEMTALRKEFTDLGLESPGGRA